MIIISTLIVQCIHVYSVYIQCMTADLHYKSPITHTQLLNQYLDMLNSSGLLVNNDSTYLAQDPVKLSILQSSLRILLGAIASNEQQV